MSKFEIGQEVVIVAGGSRHRRHLFGYRVEKVTPSGQVTVKRESDGYTRRFDKNGYEMGVSRDRFYRDTIEANVEMCRDLEKSKEIKCKIGTVLHLIEAEISNRHNVVHWNKQTIGEKLSKLEEYVMEARDLTKYLS